MEKLTLRNIKFGSFVKINILTLTSTGIGFGILLFIIGLLGGNVRANIGTTQLTGFSGGLASLIISPITFFILGLILSIFTFLPFKLMLFVIKKVDIYGDFDNYNNEEK